MAIWGVVPAAGVGRRMGAAMPKQYLELAGVPVLEHTLRRLLDHPRVDGVVVALSDDDPHFAGLPSAHRVRRAAGGEERSDSVLSALESIGAADDDWALVHDAVRPCLAATDLDRLIDTVLERGQGGLLACPVRDTMKRVRDGVVVATVPRDGLWHALTPQMFPATALRDALLSAREQGAVITDEAAAMERIGQRPLVVEGRADNIKITHPADLEMALRTLSG